MIAALSIEACGEIIVYEQDFSLEAYETRFSA